MDTTAAIPGQLDVDQVLDLVLRDEQAPAAAGRGELVAPAEELVAAIRRDLGGAAPDDRSAQEQVIALRERRRPVLDEDRGSNGPDTAQAPRRGG